MRATRRGLRLPLGLLLALMGCSHGGPGGDSSHLTATVDDTNASDVAEESPDITPEPADISAPTDGHVSGPGEGDGRRHRWLHDPKLHRAVCAQALSAHRTEAGQSVRLVAES